MPMTALSCGSRQPRIVRNRVPCSDELFSDFEDHKERLLALEEMNKRHPWLLAKGIRLEVGQQYPCNTHVFSAVSFPKGRDDTREDPLFGGVGDHP